MAEKKEKKAAGGSRIRIQYYRSAIGFDFHQKLVVKGLGFLKLNTIRELVDTPETRGMIAKSRTSCGSWSKEMSGIHTVKPNPGATHKRKRIGRGPGSGHGKTAGRGHNGQWSRSGTSQKRGFEGGQMPLHRRIPKRGFSNAPFKKDTTAVNVSDLMRFEKDSKVGPQELVASGVVKKIGKHGLRILGDEAIDRVLHVTAHYFTESAKQKITSAGGTTEVITQ